MDFQVAILFRAYELVLEIKSAGIGKFPNENIYTNVIPKDQTSDFVLYTCCVSVS